MGPVRPRNPIPMRFQRSLLPLLGAFVTLFVSSDAGALLWSSGPPNGRASQPPDFANCTQCHATNALNEGDGSLTIAAPAAYTPGTFYTVTVTIEDAGQQRWGFELVALDEAGVSAGTLAPLDNETQTSISGARTYIKHTSVGTQNGVQNGPITWHFRWVAPPAGTGSVRFYASGNAANGDFANSGDFIYSAATASAELSGDASLTLQPERVLVSRSTDLVVRARIRDHSGAANSVLLVSRVDLGGGTFFPPVGWLLPPISVSLSAQGQSDEILVHSIPATAPLISASYEGIIGRAPNVLVDSDRFGFTILP